MRISSCLPSFSTLKRGVAAVAAASLVTAIAYGILHSAEYYHGDFYNPEYDCHYAAKNALNDASWQAWDAATEDQHVRAQAHLEEIPFTDEGSHRPMSPYGNPFTSQTCTAFPYGFEKDIATPEDFEPAFGIRNRGLETLYAFLVPFTQPFVLGVGAVVATTCHLGINCLRRFNQNSDSDKLHKVV